MEHLRRAGLVRLIVMAALGLVLLAAPVALADNGQGGGPFPQVDPDGSTSPAPESGVDYVDLWATVQALSLIY